jgi:hypothetical protein
MTSVRKVGIPVASVRRCLSAWGIYGTEFLWCFSFEQELTAVEVEMGEAFQQCGLSVGDEELFNSLNWLTRPLPLAPLNTITSPS